MSEQTVLACTKRIQKLKAKNNNQNRRIRNSTKPIHQKASHQLVESSPSSVIILDDDEENASNLTSTELAIPYYRMGEVLEEFNKDHISSYHLKEISGFEIMEITPEDYVREEAEFRGLGKRSKSKLNHLSKFTNDSYIKTFVDELEIQSEKNDLNQLEEERFQKLVRFIFSEMNLDNKTSNIASKH